MDNAKPTCPMSATAKTLHGRGDRRLGSRAGMTLIEVMCAVIVTTMVLGAAMNFFVGQSRSYTAASKQFNQVQNLRFGADLLDQHSRSAGSNTTPGQPQLVYLSATAFAFNADYASPDRARRRSITRRGLRPRRPKACSRRKRSTCRASRRRTPIRPSTTR